MNGCILFMERFTECFPCPELMFHLEQTLAHSDLNMRESMWMQAPITVTGSDEMLNK